MTVSAKIKTIDNKIDKKNQHDFDRKTAQISVYHQKKLVNMDF